MSEAKPILSEGLFTELYGAAADALDRCNDLLKQCGLGAFHADNVAVLFASQRDVEKFVNAAVGAAGMEHFHKEERDYVLGVMGQETESYAVRFEFLRWPGGSGREDGLPFRIEAMVLTDGESAIHTNAVSRHYSGFPVQGSFKVQGPLEMSRVHRILRMNGAEHVETFLSTYGPYSYWRHPALGGTYLKTRINTRDKEQQ